MVAALWMDSANSVEAAANGAEKEWLLTADLHHFPRAAVPQSNTTSPRKYRDAAMVTAAAMVTTSTARPPMKVPVSLVDAKAGIGHGVACGTAPGDTAGT